MKVYRYLLAFALWIFTIFCFAQSKITIGFGYQVLEPQQSSTVRFLNNQYTPHINLSWSYTMDNVYSGMTVFHNIDQINREWFDEGDYTHINYQKGFLVDFGVWQKIKGKHYLNAQTSLGYLWNDWVLETENEDLRALIAPRYAKDRVTGIILLGYGYHLTKNTSIFLRAGYGLQNIQIGINQKL